MKTKLLITLFIFIHYSGSAQTSLQNYLDLARAKSITAQVVQKKTQYARLQFEIYKAQLKPVLTLNGNIPSFNKDNFEVRQPDGSLKFLNRSQNLSDIGISFTQPLTFSGGTISLNTSLRRFDDFAAKNYQYNGTPVFIQLQQPLFAFNKYKWDRITAPLRLEEEEKNSTVEFLQSEYDICRAYFDVLDAQSNFQLDQISLSFCRENLLIEKRRIQLGASTEDKVIQLEILQLRSTAALEADSIVRLQKMILLDNLAGTTTLPGQQLSVPVSFPAFTLTPESFFADESQWQASIAGRRKLEEARANTAKVKADKNQVTLTASYGLTNAATSVPAIYRSPNDQQRFSIGFTLPLYSWGKNKKALAAARLQEEQTVLANKSAIESYKAEISNLFHSIPPLKNKIETTLLIDKLTNKRFLITLRLYQSGKASLLELQSAQTENENARRNYLLALRNCWETYYLLRAKTGISF